jgi:hypothetical protein
VRDSKGAPLRNAPARRGRGYVTESLPLRQIKSLRANRNDRLVGRLRRGTDHVQPALGLRRDSGSAARTRSTAPRAGETPLALRAPGVSPATTACCASMMSVRSIVISRALYTNFEEGRCLTYIGRE